MPVPPASLQAGVLTWWRDHFPLDVATLYPGLDLDTQSLDEWIELRVDAWSQPPHRSSQSAATQIAVTLHLFVKTSSDQSRPHVLLEAARATLEHQTIPLHDPTLSDHPLVGYAKLRESELRNLTRPLEPATDRLTHLVLTLPGRAEPVGSE